MRKHNAIGVDLVKNVIQGYVVSSSNKELLNKELTRKKFSEFLVKQSPALAAFDSFATAHNWVV